MRDDEISSDVENSRENEVDFEAPFKKKKKSRRTIECR